MGEQPWPGKRWRVSPAAVAAAVSAGLFLARLWCERGSAPRSWAMVALAAVAGLAIGGGAVLALRYRRLAVWPLWLLAVYALWPRADARAAFAVWAVAVVAALAAWLTQRQGGQQRFGWLAEALVGMGALALYVLTLAPGVQPADAGEFQVVAYVLGIAHPPGYPLYSLLGKLFTLLPLGDPAWRVNLFAAVCAAATLVVLCRAVRRLSGSALAGVLAALALGLAPTYWSQATLANVRSLTALLTMGTMYALLRYGQERRPRWLVASAVLFGLSVTHHSSSAPLAIPYLAYLLALEPRLILQPRRWMVPLAGLFSTLLVLAYLPLRSAMSPAFDPAPIRTWSAFAEHVLALGFRGDFLYFLGKPQLGQRFRIFADILRLELGVLLAPLAVAFGALAARRRVTWLILWGGVAVVNSFAAITYRAPQTVEYLVPAYVALALGLGLGLGEAKRRWGSHPAVAVLAGIVAWLALANGLAAYPSFRALHLDRSAETQAVELLNAAPPNALVLSNWHRATPLWYEQLVAGVRRDVTVTYVYPEGATPNGEVWARRIRTAVEQGQAVLVTNRFAEYSGLPYRWQAVGDAWLAQPEPAQQAPAGLTGTATSFGDRIEFLGASVAAAEAAPGGEVFAQIAWRARSPLDRSYSWFVQLLGPQGVAGQADLSYDPSRVAAGETMVDAYSFTLRPDAAPGAYRLIAGVYITFPDGSWQRIKTAEGQDSLTLAEVRVAPRATAPVTACPLDVTFAGGSRLTGVDYDDALAGQRRVYLHWYRPAGSAAAQVTLTAPGLPAAQLGLAGGDAAGYQTVACDLPPSSRLSLALTVAGRPVAQLGVAHLPSYAPVALPVRASGSRYMDLGGEMVLIGVRQSGEPRAGQPLRVELQWLAARPLVQDYSVSVSLEGEGWRAQNDGTPALGAIPTLKWLTGWVVDDTRVVQVPSGATGAARLRLTVYDAFSLVTLPVGDERLVRAGQGVQAVLWEGTLTP